MKVMSDLNYEKARPHEAKTEATPEHFSEFLVSGAGCASCVAKIENAALESPGVQNAKMNFVARTLEVSGQFDEPQLFEKIKQIGYGLAKPESESLEEPEAEQQSAAYERKLKIDVLFALALGAPLMGYGLFGGDMSISSAASQVTWLVIGLLTALVLGFSGKHFFVGAWKSFLNRSATMDTLIALGTGTAWLYSMVVVVTPEVVPLLARHVYFEASAMIIGLINLGLLLEHRARGKTSLAIKRLIGLKPKFARVVVDGVEKDVVLSEVRVGDIVRGRPGEKIPVDGEVVEGATSVDESMLTGEPIPAMKKEGEQVTAGTIVKTGTILFKATKVGEQTVLAQIIEQVKRAQNSKPPIGRLADRVSEYFVPSILIIAIVTALAWLNFGGADNVTYAIVTATTVLIIACPCALGLATPMSIMVGVGKAAEAGILIRNGEALQKASELTTIVLDKTGTITKGQPSLTECVSLGKRTREELLVLAASLEVGSEHPLAEAILDESKKFALGLVTVDDFEAVPGHGVIANLDGLNVMLGNEKLMRDKGVDVTGSEDLFQQFASDAKTTIFLAVDGHLEGLLAIADPIKEDSAKAISAIASEGIEVVMLTGDSAMTAASVARQVGIKNYKAQVLPGDKAEFVESLKAKGKVVGMVGDGINDAPALAMSDVGFAIGAGTDVAIESADLTIMRGSLMSVLDALLVSRATVRNIKQNLFGAFFYNTAGVPVAAGVLFPLFDFLLNPVIAGAAMALSSVSVVSNANRLRFLKISRGEQK